MTEPTREGVQASAPDDLTGCTVGRFTIRSLLGSGGMGEVYRAEDRKLGRPVALKRISAKFRSDKLSRQRVLKEAQRASALASPNIAAVYDVIEEQEEVFLIMEFVEGQTLRHRLQIGVLPLEEFFTIAMQCASALCAAHRKRIVHRDIKPENIMLTSDRNVKLLDFGLAKQLNPVGDSVATADSICGGCAGTPGYMAPEVLLEKQSDGRADVFSLGVVFYEMLAGRHPFWTEKTIATANRVLNESPRPLREVAPVVPEELERIITKMLSKSATERYATADDLLVDLRRVQTGNAPVPSRSSSQAAKQRRVRTVLVLFLIVLAAVTTVATLFVLHNRTTRTVERRGWVLVLDFDNNTGNPVFDHSLSTAVAAYLEQSTQLKVFPEERVRLVLPKLGQAATARVDRRTGSQIASREGIPLMVAGGIANVGDEYILSLNLLDAFQQEKIYSAKAEARGFAQILPALNELANRLRSSVGESRKNDDPIDRPLERVTSGSLDALHKYSIGRQEHLAGNFAAAVALYKEAIREDPDFALAYARLSAVYANEGQKDLSRKALDQAWMRKERVTEAEWYVIAAQYYMLREQYDVAIENLLALVKSYPNDITGYQYLTICYLLAMDLDSAEKMARRAVELDASIMARNNLALVLLSRNQFSEAAGVLEAAQAQNRDTLGITRLLSLAYAAEGKSEKAEQLVDVLLKGSPEAQTYGDENRILLLLNGGQWSKAEFSLVKDATQHNPRFDSFMARTTLGHLYLLEGKTALALQQWRQAEGLPDLVPKERAILAAYYALAGQPKEIIRLQRALRKQITADSPRHQAYSEFLRGARLLATGNSSGAVDPLRSASVTWNSSLSHAMLAQAYLKVGRWSDAIGEYGEVLKRHGESLLDGYGLTFYFIASYYRGIAYEATGDAANARRSYEEFLRNSEGTPSMTIFQDARRRLRLLPSPPLSRVVAVPSSLRGDMDQEIASVPRGIAAFRARPAIRQVEQKS